MKILIIGSKGFIGGNLLLTLRKRYAFDQVFGCDVYFETSEKNYFQISPDSSDFNDIFRKYTFDVCVNCSGAANVSDSLVNPWKDFQLNTINVFKQLEAIRAFQPQCRYLNLSSAAVYGNPLFLPILESHFVAPISPYGYHKSQAEAICREFYQNFNVPTCSIRIFSAYGEGLKKQLFWDLYQKTLSNQPIDLYGNGRETRDFIYIKDLIDVIDLIINHASFQSECYNVGNGIEITIEEAARTFFELFNKPIEYSFNHITRSGDPNNWCADISQIKQLGYQQKYSLSEGLELVYLWLKQIEKR